MTRVTVMGLGTMGGRIARALADVGHEVRGFDPSAAARGATIGIDVHDDATTALQGAEFVVVSVPRPEHVLETARGPLADARGAVVADLSTIDPGTAREAAALLADRGVAYLDAPVLGRPDRIGAWTLPVGGDTAAVDIARTVLEGAVAKSVVRVGDVGAGSTVKLLNNLMFGAINAVTAEALTICRLAGVDPEVFVRTVAESGAATVSNLFRELAPKLLADDYEPAFMLELLEKDNRLALQLARDLGAAAPVAEAVGAINAAAVELGHGRADTGAVQELYRARSTGGR
ncbi:NAD(P)-dependent oxidoreductase [Agrococcus baldri]|uniref:3-hydroxyisobutyrate dehydrogenase n=1 Tax=Agrococcus baldri TaxID=153730 RepID=A0AA87UQP6_9MICO|nr:NAD(P)-dependent oxidoreductase [Agrococcus baldri]GEK79216.1 3-hydroxyisobutyrate dehydrogenase [Agrococcus baldri]